MTEGRNKSSNYNIRQARRMLYFRGKSSTLFGINFYALKLL